jgi:hypothetical protein
MSNYVNGHGEFVDAEDCPNKDNHNMGPDGYIAWDNWAERMSKTHNQKRCPVCRLYVIWEAKADANAE